MVLLSCVYIWGRIIIGSAIKDKKGAAKSLKGFLVVILETCVLRWYSSGWFRRKVFLCEGFSLVFLIWRELTCICLS